MGLHPLALASFPPHPCNGRQGAEAVEGAAEETGPTWLCSGRGCGRAMENKHFPLVLLTPLGPGRWGRL